MLEPVEYLRFAVALVAILAPFSALPLFLSLTAGQTPKARARIAGVAAVTVAGVLIGAALSGDLVLQVLGASLPSFRVGGGIVLLLMALSMLGAQTSPVRQTPDEAAAAEESQAVGAVPIGLPFLAGPGSISTCIIEGQRADGALHLVAVAVAILVVAAATYVTLRLADPIGRRLGVIGLSILSRMFGLLLTAIAVEGIAGGLIGLFPPLGR